MKKAIEIFKKMSLLTKIAAIMLVAAFVCICTSFLGGFFVDIFGGRFGAMFLSFSNFANISWNYVVDLAAVAALAALVIAVFSGSKKNIGVVLTAKAAFELFSLLFATPYLFMIERASFGYMNTLKSFFDDIGTTIFSFIHQIDLILALCALAALLFGVFGKRTKLFGLIIAGVFAVFATEMLVSGVSYFINIFRAFGSGEIRYGFYCLFCYWPMSTAGMLRFAALALISLGVAFSVKGAPKQKNVEEAPDAGQQA